MPKLNLTQKFIETHPDVTSTTSYQDIVQEGLYLRINKNGRKSWNVYRWVRALGRPKKVMFGTWPSWSVVRAREKAKQIVAEWDRGEGLKPEAPSLTLGEVVERRTKRLRSKGHRHPEWLATLIKNGSTDWLARPFVEITSLEIGDRHDEIAETRGPIAAARWVKSLRTLYTFAVYQCDMEMKNKAKGIDVKSDASRVRYMKPDELRLFMSALKIEGGDARDFFLLCLLTGARRGNVTAMRWADINWNDKTWTIPAEVAKAGKEIVIYLTDEAVEILRGRRQLSFEWVFPSRGKTGHLVEVWHMLRRVLARTTLLAAGTDATIDKPVNAVKKLPAASQKLGVKNLRVHDLRHHHATMLTAVGAPLNVVAAALGHSDIATTAKYAHVKEEVLRSYSQGVAVAMLGGGD